MSPSRFYLVFFITITLAAAASSASTGKVAVRQAPPGSSTAVVPVGTASSATLPQILYPAVQSLVGAPLRLFRQLLVEALTFLRSHRFLEIYDMSFWQSIAASLPARTAEYWSTLVQMESQCSQRTLCDLADLASRRLPKWLQQIALIYLNTFAETHPYYGVAISGLTSHNCALLYSECDAEAFLERIRGNVTSSLTATVAPMREAVKKLAQVATSTLDSLDVEVLDDDGTSAVDTDGRQNAPGLDEFPVDLRPNDEPSMFSPSHRLGADSGEDDLQLDFAESEDQAPPPMPTGPRPFFHPGLPQSHPQPQPAPVPMHSTSVNHFPTFPRADAHRHQQQPASRVPEHMIPPHMRRQV